MGFFRVSQFEELTSTNEKVRAAIDAGEPEGYACRALTQTGGHGRQGRLWTSPRGGLYQSVLLRPRVGVAKLPTLGIVVGLAIRGALLKLAGMPAESIQMKWPNDVMVGDSKLAGISLDTRSGAVCVGMGVNVFKPRGKAEDLLADSKYQPAFFADLAVGFTEVGGIEFAHGGRFANEQEAISAVGDAIFEELEGRYRTWLLDGLPAFIDEFRSCSYLQGKRIRMSLLNGTSIVEGEAVGIDEFGCLLVDDGSAVHSVSSGEAHIL